ncbi:hypothetical protein [Wolbachia endosymbiont (group A) of Anoplius nigerrimus]|uniref:hypothetical protein n=1 Tax=Wolbachia endosymbiont (group A) of Anoplius nigerrimus TaxID=2953979 RepID=UPI0022319C5B|nr:hypothetical protein [Wolbachia endosymbiont (group A) of Anoplius nigerrimus]
MASLKFCPQSLEIPRMNRGMTVRGGMTIRFQCQAFGMQISLNVRKLKTLL